MNLRNNAALDYRVVAISTAEDALADPNGFDIDELPRHRDELGHGFAANFPELRIARVDELFVDADIVVPDFVANAGGVVSAAFAMDARYSPFRAATDSIFSTVSDKLRSNTVQVLEKAETEAITSHEAARALAQERVRAAMLLRGKPLAH